MCTSDLVPSHCNNDDLLNIHCLPAVPEARKTLEKDGLCLPTCPHRRAVRREEKAIGSSNTDICVQGAWETWHSRKTQGSTCHGRAICHQPDLNVNTVIRFPQCYALLRMTTRGRKAPTTLGSPFGLTQTRSDLHPRAPDQSILRVAEGIKS